MVFEDDGLTDDYDDSERFALTVHGEDAMRYMCFDLANVQLQLCEPPPGGAAQPAQLPQDVHPR